MGKGCFNQHCQGAIILNGRLAWRGLPSISFHIFMDLALRLRLLIRSFFGGTVKRGHHSVGGLAFNREIPIPDTQCMVPKRSQTQHYQPKNVIDLPGLPCGSIH